MSHLSILSAPLPDLTHTTKDDIFLASSHASTSRHTLAVPDSFVRPSRLRSDSIHPTQSGAISLPGSPCSSSFPQRPGFRRAATSAAVSTISTAESRFDELHYSQTHFSRSTLLVYPESESTVRAVSGEVGAEEDIRELLLASSDEESSAPPSTPGIDSSRIPPRGSSVSLARAKQSMDSEKSALLLPEPITLLAPPATQNHERRTGWKMSHSSSELAGEAPRTSISSYRDDHSIRSGSTSTGSSSKRRSKILMKIIPFARETPAPPAADPSQRFGTFPRVRSKDVDEPVETLAARFCDLSTSALSPPNSASSVNSTFSLSNGSTPATSPELSLPDLPNGRGSGSYGRRARCPRRPSSLDSVRSLFSMSSGHQTTAPKPITAEESEWEKVLQDAEKRASWQSSINHRPRQHTPSTPNPHARIASYQMSWPRSGPRPASAQQHQQNGLLLEHMFVDAGDDGQYGRGSYSAVSAGGGEGSWSLPVSVAGSRHASVADGSLGHSRSMQFALGDDGEQGRFGTLPRVKSRRPSATAVRGDPAPFELKSAPRNAAVQGTSSLGRATLRKRAVPDAASMWQVGRRRSSGLAPPLSATTRMPTIPQGHSRDSSLVDEPPTDDPPWLGIDPYAQPSYQQDSLTPPTDGEYLPFRFYARRESQDVLVRLANAASAAAPVFNLHPFQSRARRPSMGARSASSYELYKRSFACPDVPMEAEDDDLFEDDDGNGWCRRRSTVASVQVAPTVG
ncbi:conserved hypothetical protein [Sporisorium reilianum SRZ2]|uniref:Uncharacterized protein n=1 Tax=Sporisorium reilianum (strain SRZ2) TaxID=999809 RepID=E6ZNZ4_SPORE|nr:conserved hypothetical protein [Sporisorium reilianum SRZ2]